MTETLQVKGRYWAGTETLHDAPEVSVVAALGAFKSRQWHDD